METGKKISKIYTKSGGIVEKNSQEGCLSEVFRERAMQKAE